MMQCLLSISGWSGTKRKKIVLAHSMRCVGKKVKVLLNFCGCGVPHKKHNLVLKSDALWYPNWQSYFSCQKTKKNQNTTIIENYTKMLSDGKMEQDMSMCLTDPFLREVFAVGAWALSCLGLQYVNQKSYHNADLDTPASNSPFNTIATIPCPCYRSICAAKPKVYSACVFLAFVSILYLWTIECVFPIIHCHLKIIRL